MWKLDNQEKDTVEYIVAILVIIFGCVLTLLGFFAPPVGEIHPTIITVLGELLIFAGAIFHLNLSFKRKDEELRNDIRHQLDDFKNRLTNGDKSKENI